MQRENIRIFKIIFLHFFHFFSVMNITTFWYKKRIFFYKKKLICSICYVLYPLCMFMEFFDEKKNNFFVTEKEPKKLK